MASRDELVPPVSWAQRRNELWLSCDVPHATDVSMLSPTDGEDLVIRFVDRNTLQPYVSHIHFYAPVKSFLGMPTVLARSVRLRLTKSQSGEWPRLTKERVKELPFLLTYNWDLDATLDEDSSASEDESTSSTSSSSVCKCDDEKGRVEELPDDSEVKAEPVPDAKPQNETTRPKPPTVLPPKRVLRPEPKKAQLQFDLAQVLLIVAITSVSSILLSYLWLR